MNHLLKAILDINHLMVRECDRGRILQETCDLLEDHTDHLGVWVAILGEGRQVKEIYSSGQCPDVSALREDCEERGGSKFDLAIKTSGVVDLVEKEEGTRSNQRADSDGIEAATGNRIQYAFDVPAGRGVLTVCLEPSAGHEDDEQDLIATVAEDLSFVLGHLEQEKIREEAEEERKEALAESRRAEERYRTLFNNLGDAIFIHDFQGEIVEVNEAACEHLRYERHELVGMNVTDIDVNFEPEDTLNMRVHLEEGEGALIRSAQQTRDGQVIPVEIHSRIIDYGGETLVLSIARDVTARQKANKQRNRLLEAVRAAQEAIIVTSENGRIIFSNQAVEDLFGGDEDELQGEPVWRLLASDDPQTKIEDIRGTLSRGEGWEGELQAQTVDGVEFVCYATVTAVRGSDGQIINYIATANDITEQKETEAELRETVEELRKTERQVIDQERQRALSQMASGIAHDFNNALSTIRGFTELLLEDAEKRDDDEVLSKYLSVIDSAANNAADTVRRMRKFYRPAEEAELRPLDINNIVEEAISLTRPKWEQEAQASGKTINIERDLEEVPLVDGNEAELHEMLANIIFNAVDAIEKEGTISIRTYCEDGDVVMDVGDDGRGMETYTRRHCADPFYTTKGEEGTGLGLAVTAGIIRRHDGQMEIESEKGSGSTVSVILPAEQESDYSSSSEQSDESYKNGENLKVLVAEDDVAQQELIADMLDVMGHTCDIEEDGESAMEEFERGAYDVVLTDRAMPKMRGDEVARRVRQRRKDIPIIMVTGFGDMMDAAAEHPDDVDLVVSKPLSLKKLSSAIEDAQQAHSQ